MIKIEEIQDTNIQELETLLLNYKNAHSDLSFREDYQEIFNEYLHNLTKDNDKKAFIAKEGTQLVGLIIGMITDNSKLELPDKIGYIGFLSVLDTHQRKGIGKDLYKCMIEWFKVQNICNVELYTSINNAESRLFWSHLGYETYLEKRRTKI